MIEAVLSELIIFFFYFTYSRQEYSNILFLGITINQAFQSYAKYHNLLINGLMCLISKFLFKQIFYLIIIFRYIAKNTKLKIIIVSYRHHRLQNLQHVIERLILRQRHKCHEQLSVPQTEGQKNILIGCEKKTKYINIYKLQSYMTL